MDRRQGQLDPHCPSEWSLSPEEDSRACEELLQWIADTCDKHFDEVKKGAETVYKTMSRYQGCSYRHWLRWCDNRTSYLCILSPHSKDPDRLSVRFFREAKPLQSLSLERYSGSVEDLRHAHASTTMFGTVNSVTYPGKGRVIFNVTTDLGIQVKDTRSESLAIPPIGKGRTRAISRLDSTTLSVLIWLHTQAPKSVSQFLERPAPNSHHAWDTFERVLGDRRAMYRGAYANILGYAEGVARCQRLASLKIYYDNPSTNTGDQVVPSANVNTRVRIRPKGVHRAQLLIGLSWLSGVVTIVLSTIYREQLGTDIPAIAIAVVSLNFIIVTQAVVGQMTPEYTVFEVLLGKLTVVPSRRRTLMLYGEDAENYLAMTMARKRPEVLKKQGACFLRGSSDTGNVKLDGVRMNLTTPGLRREINKNWVPVVVFEERTESMEEDQGLVVSLHEECTMLDFTMSSASSLHFVPTDNEGDVSFTTPTTMWESSVKAGFGNLPRRDNILPFKLSM